MKKITFVIASAMTMLLAGFGTASATEATSTDSTPGTDIDIKTLVNTVSSVIGVNTLTEENLVGTWKYSEPGAAFTSESTLAKAGGEVAASEVREKLAEPYQKAGITSSNTQFTFNDDGTFKASIAGKSFSGKYTYDASSSELKLTPSSVILKVVGKNITGYATRSGVSGLSILFESKKILTIIQVLTSLSGNSTLSTIGSLSKNYDGVRVGFDMTK